MSKGSQDVKDHCTPAPIARLLAELGAMTNPETILDMCCGFGNILQMCHYGKTLHGIDNVPEVIDVARFLNEGSEFRTADVLETEFECKYDLIFCDPPAGQRTSKDGKEMAPEAAFIEKALALLNPGGVLIFLAPKVFLSGKPFSSLRSRILHDFGLRLLVHLDTPAANGSFNKAVVCYVSASAAAHAVFIYNYGKTSHDIADRFKRKQADLIVEPESLADRWDGVFKDTQFREIQETLAGKETKYLHEMAEVFPGYHVRSSDRKPHGTYLIVGSKNFGKTHLLKSGKDTFTDVIDTPAFAKAMLKPGDVIASLHLSASKVYVYSAADPPAIAGSTCAIIRSSDSEYIASYLHTAEGQKLFLKQTWSTAKSDETPLLSVEDLQQIKIPILPFDNLETLSDRKIAASSLQDLQALRVQIEQLQQELESHKSKNRSLEEFIQDRLQKINEKQEYSEILFKIKGGESKKLEFKSSLRMNLKSKNVDPEVEHAALKAIVAFCNSEGGELFIGVNDKGEILGIDSDQFANDDKYLLHINNIIKQRIVPVILSFIDTRIAEIEGKKICIVSCSGCTKDVWLKSNKGTEQYEFYIRSGPSSTPLPAPDAVVYIREHFRNSA